MEADLRVGGVEDVVVVLHAEGAEWNWSLAVQSFNKLFEPTLLQQQQQQ